MIHPTDNDACLPVTGPRRTAGSRIAISAILALGAMAPGVVHAQAASSAGATAGQSPAATSSVSGSPEGVGASGSSTAPEAPALPPPASTIQPVDPDSFDNTFSSQGAAASAAPAGVTGPSDDEADGAQTSGAVVDVPQIDDSALYGPPSPKAKHGQIGTIYWTEPGKVVPPALEEAVNIVTRNYPSAQAARSALKAAASDVKAAKWLRFPSLTGNVSYLDDARGPDPQIVVEAPIWSGGRLSANIRRAKAEEDASSAQYVETVQDLALTVSNTYFEIARLTMREQLLKESLEEHNRLVGTMERRVDQEVSPLADLELARSRAAQIEDEYSATTAQRLTALRVLAQLIADPSYDLGPIPYYNPDMELPNLDILEEQAVAYDPTIDRLKSVTDVSRAELDTRKASILPQVSAQYSYDDFYKSRVGVVLRSQTTGGLSQFSEINSASLRIQTALENMRVAEQELRRTVAADIIAYQASKKRAAISTTAAATSGRVSESYTRQFIAGRRSWLDVMNALREAVNAQIGKSDAEITAMSTASKLLIESGRWRPVFTGEPQ